MSDLRYRRGGIWVVACLLVGMGSSHGTGAPSLDGFLDDEFWHDSARMWHVTSESHPDHHALFYLGFDQEFLYIAADVTDRNVLAVRSGRGEALDFDDAVTVLLDFSTDPAEKDPSLTREYAFGAGGGVNWTHTVEVNGEPFDPTRVSAITPKSGLRSAFGFKPGTTPNASGDEDEGYIIEAAIPWDELPWTPPILPIKHLGVNFVASSPPRRGVADPHPLTSTPGLTPVDMRDAQLWERIGLSWSAPFRRRGLALDWPGSEPDSERIDRASWSARLADMADHQFNRLLLLPDRSELSRQSLRDLEWLARAASRSNIEVFVMVERPGGDAHVSLRDNLDHLNRQAPSLTGAACRIGRGGWLVEELMSDFAKETGAEEMLPLIGWVRDVPVDRIRTLRETIPGLEILLDVQGQGLWTKPIVDPEVVQYASGMSAGPRTDGISWSPAVIGGPTAAYAHLTWCHPEWMWTMTGQVRRYGLAGMYLRVKEGETSWLLEEVFGAYAVHTGKTYNPQRWVRRLEEVYGTGAYSGQLLEAWEHASSIMPTLLHLVSGDADRFAPQMGLLLADYVSLPTVSEFLDRRRIESTGSPWHWPRPGYGSPIASIWEDVNRAGHRSAERPGNLTNDIGRHVDAIRVLMRNLRNHPPANSDQAARLERLLDRIEFTASLGRHYHHKLRAAIGWERAVSGRENLLNCIRGLRESLEAWEDAVPLAEKFAPAEVAFEQIRNVNVPPWTPDQIDQSYTSVSGHWRDQLRRFERELDLVQAMSRTPGSLPLWDAVDAVAFDELRVMQTFGFEEPGDDRYMLGAVGGLTRDPDLSIVEEASLLADAGDLSEGWHVAWETVPEHCPLGAGRSFQVSIIYRVVEPAAGDEPSIMVGLRESPRRRTSSRLEPAEIHAEHPAWQAPRDHRGSRIVRIPPMETETYRLVIGVRAGASIIVDHIAIYAHERFVPVSGD